MLAGVACANNGPAFAQNGFASTNPIERLELKNGANIVALYSPEHTDMIIKAPFDASAPTSYVFYMALMDITEDITPTYPYLSNENPQAVQIDHRAEPYRMLGWSVLAETTTHDDCFRNITEFYRSTHPDPKYMTYLVHAEDVSEDIREAHDTQPEPTIKIELYRLVHTPQDQRGQGDALFRFSLERQAQMPGQICTLPQARSSLDSYVRGLPQDKGH
jgi:hypothetical protein